MSKRTSDELPTAWHGAGARVKCRDGAVFVRTEGDLRSAPPLLLLHGFPTSSHDFSKIWTRLNPRRPLVTLDFLGFGVSDKPEDHGYSLFEQADLVIEVCKHLGLSSVHVLAHDMGTSVATELCARRERGLLPIEMRSLTLSNGSVLVEMAHLTAAQQILRRPLVGDLFARLSSYVVFRRTMRKIFASPDVIDESELELMWSLLTRDEGKLRMPQLIAYIEERYRFERRWVGALSRLDIPTLILWGARDPVAVLAIGERLAKIVPGARLRIMPHLGHYPQLEDPGAFASEVNQFLADQ